MSSSGCVQCACSSEFSISLIVCGVCTKKFKAVGTAQVPSSACNKRCCSVQFRAQVRIVSSNMSLVDFFDQFFPQL